MLLLLLVGGWSNPGHLQGAPVQVAVLDFKAENATNGNDDWTVGLADFVELALQKEGVETLERRQIRLVLGERELQSGGMVSAADLRKRGLPAVNYFVSGSVRRVAGNKFTLTVSLHRADNATVENTLTRRGAYPAEWLAAIDSVAKEAGDKLRAPAKLAPTRSEFESLTWLPEAALPFFKGLEYYARGDLATAIPWLRNAHKRDPHFTLAKRWEARAYRQLNFPELARAVEPGEKKDPTSSPNRAPQRPVVTVGAVDSISTESRAAFQLALVQGGQFGVFEPASIGATAREIDLQLTGQMAAPLNGRSVWLAVDYLIFLESAGNKLRARQQHLLSGEIVRQVEIVGPTASKPTAWADLAGALLRAPLLQASGPSVDSGPEAAALTDPAPGDRSEVAFAKVLRLARADPEQVRPWIALADQYGDWDSRTWLLQQAIAAIDRDRNQPDAPVLLASALWRLRTMQRTAWMYSRETEYQENSVTNDFARLLEWFPASDAARTALAETARQSGKYVYSYPADPRYLMNDVYALTPEARRRKATVGPGAVAEAAATTTRPAATDAQREQKLNEFLRANRTALAWQVVNTLRTPDTASVRPQFRAVYETLQAAILRENEAFQAFTNSVARQETLRALEQGQGLLDCALRQQRLAVIQHCGELLKQTKGFPEQFDFVFTQAQRYRNDFLIDAVTGAPGENISYQIDGNPPKLTRWTTHGTAYELAILLGDLADAARRERRPDLVARVFADLQADMTLPLQNRLTAAYDLALIKHEQGRAFEALEILRDVLRQTEGTGLAVARRGSWSGALEAAAFEALRQVRLYTSAEVPVCENCGVIPAAAPSKPADLEALNEELAALWQQTVGGVGADNRLIQAKLVARKEALMPVILYKLRNDQDVSRMLSFCGQLGTNALIALPWITHYVCHAKRIEDYNNALYALGQMGPAAACAKPLLILTLEDSRAVFNAKYAIKKVGPAPRKLIPQLAQLLQHQNAAVSTAAARAMIESAALPAATYAGQTEEQLIVSLRTWWEQEGSHQDWADH